MLLTSVVLGVGLVVLFSVCVYSLSQFRRVGATVAVRATNAVVMTARSPRSRRPWCGVSTSSSTSSLDHERDASAPPQRSLAEIVATVPLWL
jgi:hypothetical protein